MQITNTILNQLRFALQAQPENATLHLGMGRALFDSGDIEQAVKHYSKAVEYEPENADAYLHRGIGLCHLSKSAEAIVDYNKVIELQPENSLAYLRRAVSNTDLSEFDLAKADLAKAEELESANGGFQGELAQLVRDLQSLTATKLIATQPDQARACLSELLPNVSGDEMLMVFHGYAEAGFLPAAIAFYQEARDGMENMELNNYMYFGSLANQAGKHADALQIFEDGVTAYPKDQTIAHEFGWTYFLNGDVTTAVEMLRSVIQSEPNNARGYCTLAWVLSEAGMDRSQAEEAMELANKMLPLEGRTEDRKLKVLARCQLRLGQTDEARVTIKKAIEVASPDQLPILQSMLP